MFTAHGITPPSVFAQAQSGQDLGQSIKEVVDQATREAMQEVRDAQQQVRDASQRVRDAQQGVRDAQQQMREARTADQHGAAAQAMVGAQEELRAAQAELQRVQSEMQAAPRVYTEQRPNPPWPTIPPEATQIATGFFITCVVMVVGWPISRALGRRLERRSAAPALESGMSDQLERIEQAVEAMAIEVERISESQRFLAKLRTKSASAAD
jgi:predicted  nucleic acid-binding Zn-ribbon protein